MMYGKRVMGTRVLVFVAMLTACGDAAITDAAGGDGGSSGTTGASGTTSSQASTSTSSSSGVVTGDSSGSSSSTGEVLVGPGCGDPPACDGTVFEGSVRIESAADLPLIEGVSTVTGFVEIVGTDLECLDTLACLEDVGRDLRVQGNDALRSTAGLFNVSALGSTSDGQGDVIIAENPVLESLDGLAIERIDGVVAVWRNDALRDIPGFAELRRLFTLSVQDNPVLESLEGLRDLNRLERCDVSHNGSLCLSEVFAVCGDVVEEPDSVTDFNDDAC